MEDEISKSLDYVLSINHKIVSYFIDIAEKENQGIKFDKNMILENPILKNLFEKEQEHFRKIYSIINEYIQNDNSGMELGDTTTILNTINDYIVEAFQSLRYVSRNTIKYNEEFEEEQVIEPSIFKNDKYEAFRKCEYGITLKNIQNLQTRLCFEGDLQCLPFWEKEEIIINISENRFLKDYAIKQIEEYLKDLKIKEGRISKEEYKKEKQQLTEKKYIYYYQYLNNIYNGVLQENDIKYFRTIKKIIDDGLETLILDMDSREIENNIKINCEGPKKSFKNDMKVILGPTKNVKTYIENTQQVEEKIDEEAEK